VNSLGVSTTYIAIIANRDSHSLTHGQIWILLKSFLKIFAKTIIPQTIKPYKNFCYLVEYILQGLYALGISYPSGIMCFRHSMFFRDYVLQAFHIFQGF
jgi:hypothetical protein